jgi:hypothetical protein
MWPHVIPFIPTLNIHSNINKINLFNLIKGSSLIVLYTLAKNKIRIDFNILINTKANRFVFINLTLADQLYKELGL